jgi:predicted permease
VSSVITVAIPLFAMILAGYLAVRSNVLTAEASNGLVAAVFWLFLPFFVYTKLTDIDVKLLGSGLNVLQPYYLAGLVVMAIAVVSARLMWGYDPRSLTIRGLASISGVVGYMGLPLILMVLGKEATLPSIILVTADNLVILAGGSLMMEIFAPRTNLGEGRGRPLRIIASTGKAMVKNPLLLAVGAGLLSLSFGWKLPAPAQFFAQQLTVAAGPCALVALGAALAIRRRAAAASTDSKTDVATLVALKVVVFPLLVYVLGAHLFALPRVVLQVAVLMAALPVAVNVFILAARSNTYVEQSSRVMLFSTLLSVFVVSGLLVAMGH